MANTDTTELITPKAHRLHPAVLLGILALLAPLSYAFGRLSPQFFTNAYFTFIASGVAAGALGVMIGIPVGIFFGTMRGGVTTATTAPLSAAKASGPNTQQMERNILEQIRSELKENLTLFEARKGSTTMFARIDYIMPFWEAVKASGRLFVMQDALLMNTIATAYYWLEQATHLEKLAYDAKYGAGPDQNAAKADHLIAEARLFDGQLESALSTAVKALDAELGA